MRPNLLWIILAASLVVNVFLLGGFFYQRAVGPGGAVAEVSVVDEVAEALSLAPDQHEALAALRERALERRQSSREAWKTLRVAVVGELAKPEFDRDAVLAIYEARMETMRGSFENVAANLEDLHGYLKTLTPEQRQDFLRMAEEQRMLFRLLFRRDRSKRGS